MKKIITLVIVFISLFTFAQEDDKTKLIALKKANDYVYEGNNLINNEDFVTAEMAYRKAISEKPSLVAGAYNLGNAYYNSGNFEEALYRHQQAAEVATSKIEKHKAFHNIGNILMENKKCKEAVEAYKNALRNDPTDDETRYNLGVAKACAQQQQDQQDQNKDEDKKEDKKEDQENKENKDNKDKEGDNEEDKKDKGDQEKKEGDDEKDDKGKPKDEKDDKGKGDEEKKDQKPKPQQGQLSPQQIKNLLEAMNNQEQKVQEKINAEKQKGVKVKTEKDW